MKHDEDEKIIGLKDIAYFASEILKEMNPAHLSDTAKLFKEYKDARGEFSPPDERRKDPFWALRFPGREDAVIMKRSALVPLVQTFADDILKAQKILAAEIYLQALGLGNSGTVREIEEQLGKAALQEARRSTPTAPLDGKNKVGPGEDLFVLEGGGIGSVMTDIMLNQLRVSEYAYVGNEFIEKTLKPLSSQGPVTLDSDAIESSLSTYVRRIRDAEVGLIAGVFEGSTLSNPDIGPASEKQIEEIRQAIGFRAQGGLHADRVAADRQRRSQIDFP